MKNAMTPLKTFLRQTLAKGTDRPYRLSDLRNKQTLARLRIQVDLQIEESKGQTLYLQNVARELTKLA